MFFQFTGYVLWAVSMIVALPTLYYTLLCLVYLFQRRRKPHQVASQGSKIVILIPAHNEEETILKTLDSCQKIAYPKENTKIYVILDNCTDATKKLVEQRGVNFLERTNQHQRGKGFALQWAFEQLESIDYDAVAIVDADCELSKNSLSAIDSYLEQGYQALQLNDISSNPDASPLSYILSVGNFIENEYFSYPKNDLGLAVQCRGTGMVFSKKLLNQIPWDASTITEDMEYSIKLFRQNINVYFIREAFVQSEFPDTNHKFFIQRTRWAEGNLSFSKNKAPQLIKEGLIRKKRLIFDAGITLYIISKPLIILLTFVNLLISSAFFLFAPVDAGFSLLTFNSFIFTLLIFYFLSAIFLYGLSWKRFKMLMFAPIAILNLLKVSIKGVKNSAETEWNKTPRS